MTEKPIALEPSFADAIMAITAAAELVRGNPPPLAFVVDGHRQGV